MDKLLRVRHVNDYARYYSLQLSTSATTTNSDLLPRFEALLRKYYDDGLQRQLGQPTVKYCAQQLFLSPNYFGDLFRQMTGDNASSAIRRSPPSHTSAATAPSTLASRPASTARAFSPDNIVQPNFPHFCPLAALFFRQEVRGFLVLPIWRCSGA